MTPDTEDVHTTDTTAGTISISTVAGNDVIDDSEDNSVTLQGTTSGIENGQTVTVTILDAGSTVVYSGTATVTANAWSISGVDSVRTARRRQLHRHRRRPRRRRQRRHPGHPPGAMH